MSGKGFFSRSKHKVAGLTSSGSRPSESHQSSSLDIEAQSTKSSARSVRSQHSISSNKDYRETIYGNELDPLNNTAGVVTSIPYDSVVQDLNRTPITVDFPRPVSRGDDGREITPHSIGRMGDFHQYPSVAGPPQNHYSHPTGPRPPPGSSGSLTAGNSYYAPSREYAGSTTSSSSPRNTNGGQGQMYYPSNSTQNSDPRNSDQMSIYSSLSSATRNSMLSVAPTMAEMMQFPAHSGSMTEFHMERPEDDSIVEKMFYELMIKRGYMNLPDPAKRVLMAKPTSGKWLMIYQDKLGDWQTEQKRRAAASSSSGKDLDEDSPQWYVKKIMEGTITTKQLASLSVSLRTQPIG